MGEINVQSTVINTHLFFIFVFTQYLFIYLFLISVKWYTFICETAFTNHKHIFCVVVFVLWGP